ncbi:hypothetical protein [Ekhidna sp.]|uniref:RNA polymerase sigma factor n=1 Tax=Ekhidna sp. TaxID=2608089 RepID=UPI0032977684
MSQEEAKWESIINDLKNGNNEVLRIFFEKHSRYCISRLTKENQCTKADAEDIFVESIMNLREKLVAGTVDKVMNERSYLYKTCYNMFLVRYRNQKKVNSLSDEITRFYYDSEYQSEETKAMTNELMKITMSAWEHLKEKCRDILHFFYVDKLRMEEISHLMELSNADVAKSTKSRCYKKFMEKAMELKEAESIPSKK